MIFDAILIAVWLCITAFCIFVAYNVGYAHGCVEGWLYSKYRLTHPKIKLEKAGKIINDFDSTVRSKLEKDIGKEKLKEVEDNQHLLRHRLN